MGGETLWVLQCIGRLVGVVAISIVAGVHMFEHLSLKHGKPARDRRFCALYKAIAFTLFVFAWAMQ